MALEMKVYKDLTSVEAKVMWGLSWRQLAATAILLPLGGGLWFLFHWVLHFDDIGMYLIFLLCLPVALWGWWRPHKLKPEHWIRYVFRHQFGQKTYLLDGKEIENPRNAVKPGLDERSRR